MPEIDQVEFGEVRANVAALMKNDEAKTEALRLLADAVQKIQLQLAQANGGWKMFLGIGTAIATAGAGFGWIVHEFFRR